jgi:hypothetical protein
MSLSDMIATDVSDVFLRTDDFAATVHRYKNGERINGGDFTGIVTITQAEPTDQFGKGKLQHATLVCASTVELKKGDALRHDGIRYEVESITDPEHGMVTVQMIRDQGELRGGKELKNGDL